MLKDRIFGSLALVVITTLGLLFSACCPMLTGTNVYSKYGFSFEYPAGAHIYEQGFSSPTPDENSGMVGWETADEVFVLVWFNTTIVDSELAEELIDSQIASLEAQGAALIGSNVTTQMGGFDIMYQLFDITMEGKELNGIVSLWYCEPSTTAFWATVLVTDAALAYLEDFLSTFDCQ